MGEDAARKALNAIVDALQPLPSADRKRAVFGALHFLEEDWVPLPRNKQEAPAEHAEEASDVAGAFPPAAKTWMKKNELTAEAVESVFSFDHDKVSIIADVPGRGKRDMSIAIYTLVGLGTFLKTGERTFQDDAAREVCNTHSAYDQANHAATMREMKSELTGNKKSGWTITMPGLKKGAEIVKKIVAGE
jgi:hypothetical protein